MEAFAGESNEFSLEKVFLVLKLIRTVLDVQCPIMAFVRSTTFPQTTTLKLYCSKKQQHIFRTIITICVF